MNTTPKGDPKIADPASMRTDIQVRSHTTFSVHRYRSDLRSGSQEELASGLNLLKAIEVAERFGAGPHTRVRLIEANRQRYSVADALYANVFRKLLEFGEGTSVTFQIDGSQLVGDWLYGMPWTPLEHVPRNTEVDDAGETNWQIGGLMWTEAEGIKKAMAALPHPLAAAIRRNARSLGDSTMLRLLDEAQVATDA